MRIVVIGGAGVRTVTFINGLLKRYKRLNITEVLLYDIDRGKLEIIEKLCRYVVIREKESLLVKAVNDVSEALIGADYVVTTLRVGADHSRVLDETIALKHGVIGQETTGVGGLSMALRTIPVLVEYCELISKLAPNAWIFNFTNPSGLVTQALKDAGFDKVIGICDAPSSTKTRMAAALHVSEENLYTEFFGLNHLSWIRSVKVVENGNIVSSRELVSELIQDKKFLSEVQEFAMFDPEVFAITGYLPNEYLYYYYHREKALEHMLAAKSTRGMAIEKINRLMFEELNKINIDAEPEEALQTFLYYMYVREYSYMSIETGSNHKKEINKGQLTVPDGMGYAGVMLDCIEGLQSDTGRYLVLSVPNENCIECLDKNDVIEVTCNVSRKGIVPVSIGRVPEHCAVLIKAIKNYERLAVEAVKEKSMTKAVEALTFHPLVNSFSLAKELVEEYDREYCGILK